METVKKIPYSNNVDLKEGTKYLISINDFIIPFPAQNNAVVIDKEKAYCIVKKTSHHSNFPCFKQFGVFFLSTATGKFQPANFLFKSLQNELFIKFEIENPKNNVCMNLFFVKENSELSAFVFDTYEKNSNPRKILAAKTNTSKLHGSYLNIIAYLNGRIKKSFRLELKDLSYRNINPKNKFGNKNVDSIFKF